MTIDDFCTMLEVGGVDPVGRAMNALRSHLEAEPLSSAATDELIGWGEWWPEPAGDPVAP